MSFCVVQKVGYTRHGRRFFGENLSLTFPVIGWKLSFKILGPNLLERSKLHKYFPGIGIWLVAPWSSWGEVARPGHSLDPGLSRNPEPALAGAGPPIREVCVLGPGYAVIPRMSGRVSCLSPAKRWKSWIDSLLPTWGWHSALVRWAAAQ